MEEWLQIYRGYTAAELAAEIVWLKKWSRNPFNAQAEGNRSYSRSTAEMRTRLAAATQVEQERGGSDDGRRHMVPDFSGIETW